MTLTINGQKITAREGATVLEAAQSAGIAIPTLCHSELVKAYGACGVCVVEEAKSPRLLRACSVLAADGMDISTHTERVFKTRKAALELLLSDHKGDCKAPCTLACPAQTDCQGYASLIAKKQYKEAVALIMERVPLPSSIGRVCPRPCEKKCRRELVEQPVGIASLKYFAADKYLGKKAPLPQILKDSGKRVAIVGGGPAGLTAAYYLRRLGHSVTVFDAMPKLGGMLRYGIPEYRLPKKILDGEIQLLERMGIELKANAKIDEAGFEKLRKDFNAVVIAIGAWVSYKLNIPGEELKNVYHGIDFLREVARGAPPYLGKRVAVIGGGNTAMDACRTAVRLGAESVYISYRRTKAEMPADPIEIEEADEEGVVFKYLTHPAQIIGKNGAVTSIKLQKMKLGEPDKSGRRSPVPIDGEFENLAVDNVIAAIGQGVNADGFKGLALTKWGTVIADENTFETNLKGVFAVGDATNNGADIAITAIGEAGRAAVVIDEYVRGITAAEGRNKRGAAAYVNTSPTTNDFADKQKQPRAKMRHMKSAERRSNFKEVNYGYNETEAVAEAARCLSCGCNDLHDCGLIALAGEYGADPKKYAGGLAGRVKDYSHPAVEINLEKCILCGLCVRVCSEVERITALGLSGRGFTASAGVAFGAPLANTNCNSCGKCAEMCPTGALMKKTGAGTGGAA